MAAPHVRLVELLRASPRSVFSADARGCVFAVSDSATAEDWVKVLAKDPGALLRAVRSGDNTAVAGLIDIAQADLQVVDGEKNSPLHLAAHMGNLQAAELLIERGALVDALDEDGQTPLHAAAYDGNLEVVELLIKSGANLFALSLNGETPLMLAAKDSEKEVVAALEDALRIEEMRKEAEQRFWTNHLQSNPHALMEAVKCNDLKKTMSLLQQPMSKVNDRGEGGRTVLHMATAEGNINMVKMLLKYGAQVNLASEVGNTALHRAAQMGHLEVSQALLDAGADVDAREASGNTPLHFASGGGYRELVEMLLEARADVNAVDHIGCSPLHNAAYWGHVEVAKALVRNGAKVDAISSNGETPTSMAQKNREMAMVRWLTNLAGDRGSPHNRSLANSRNSSLLSLEDFAVRASTRGLQGARRSRSVVSDGSDKSDPTPPSRKASSDRNGPVSEPITTTTARRFEAKRSDRYNEPPTSNLNNFKSSNQTQPGHPSELMTAAPVHPDRASPRSLSVPENSALAKPLLEAADKGQLHKVEELLNSGAPLGAADRFGLNALHKAASRGHTELVEVLLARGIDVKQVDKSGSSALHKACAKGHSAAAEVMLAVDSDPDPRDNCRQTPLHKAASRGHVETVKMLLAANADINATCKDGDTPLALAQLHDQKAVMRVLFTHAETTGANNVSEKKPSNSEACQSLFKAVELNDALTLRELLDGGGVHPDITDKNGNTPLHVAAQMGHKAMVQVLLEHGADIHASGNLAGATPLHVGSTAGSLAVVELLLKYGAEVSAKDIFGSSPLHDAANEQVAAKLLEYGADIHMKSKTGNCPLHRAASNGRIDVARLLLNSGADLYAKSNTGRTALALAHQFDEAEMAELLQEVEYMHIALRGRARELHAKTRT